MSTVTKNGQAVGEWDMPNSPLTKANNPFQKAKKDAIKLRMALYGPSGSGKTMSALKFATELGGRIAFADGEDSSALRYADLFEFDHVNMTDFSPDSYIQIIHAAEEAGYNTLILDLSPAWNGPGGILEQVDIAARRSKSTNSFAAWNEVKPLEQALWKAILHAKCHVIACLRSKTEYVVEENDKGKKVPRKIGTAPVQREGLEYEFDIVGELTVDNDIFFTKTRCVDLKGRLFNKPGKDVMDIVIPWLGSNAATEAEEVRTSHSSGAIEQPQHFTGSPRAHAEDHDTGEGKDLLRPLTGNGYPDNEIDTIGRILKGEELLREHKVKGWLNDSQRAKSRAEYCPNSNFHDSSLGQLHHYLKHLRGVADQI